MLLANAGVTQLVECNLAKVDVEGSNPFTRSIFKMIFRSKTVTTVLQRPVKFFGLLLIALSFFSLAGGPLALVQTVAWAKMLHDYSAQESVVTAFQKTFSGKYPCSLCQKIAAAKKKEKKTTVFNVDKSMKATLSLVALNAEIPFPKKKKYPPTPCLKNVGLSQEPPTPYPRS